MNRQEAGAVLALMTAAWPNQKVTEQTARVWIDRLARYRAEDGIEAAQQLIESEEWFPPVTKFVSAVQDVARRRARKVVALPSAERRIPCPPTLLEQMRSVVKGDAR